MWRKFRQHKLGMVGLIVLFIILIVVIFAEFTAPYGINQNVGRPYMPPQVPHFIDESGEFHFRPFVYSLDSKLDMETGKTEWSFDPADKNFIYLFVRGSSYRFFGLKSNIHLFGTKEGSVHFLGTDPNGRDVFSRIIYGGRTSIGVSFLAAVFSLGLGTIVGLMSGYFGGVTDLLSQRVVELSLIIPSVPLGLALAAFLPADVSPFLLVIGVAVVISIIRWGETARQIRGKALSIRHEEFVAAAKASGAGPVRIMFKHVLPPIFSHLIVLGTLIIPQAMVMEASISFLGFGVRPPLTSWGLLLKRAQQSRVIQLYPWLIIPGFAIMVTVLTLNFIGDGIRDAADPYSQD